MVLVVFVNNMIRQVIEGKLVTAEQILAETEIDVERVAQKVTEAIIPIGYNFAGQDRL